MCSLYLEPVPLLENGTITHFPNEVQFTQQSIRQSCVLQKPTEDGHDTDTNEYIIIVVNEKMVMPCRRWMGNIEYSVDTRRGGKNNNIDQSKLPVKYHPPSCPLICLARVGIRYGERHHPAR